MNELTRHIDQIRKLCKSNKVKTLFAFGSMLSQDFKTESDINLIVDFDAKDPLTYSDSYLNLKIPARTIISKEDRPSGTKHY